MKLFTRAIRLIHISYVLLKYGLDDIVLATHLFRPVRFLAYFSFSRFTGVKQKPRGERIRKALEELGPIFVKFGQVLSTRVDLLPEDIIRELARLQDQVPPFSGFLAEKMVQQALQVPLNQIFQNFNTVPIASASIAQVHEATLLNGKQVVVKVLRPNIQSIIEQDVALLNDIAKLAYRYSKRARLFKPIEIVAEFEKTLLDELDMMREAANASQLRRNFQNSTLLYIPEIHWDLTKHTILVMERIYGIHIYNFELLTERGFDLKQLAELGVEIFFSQVFKDSFFHADMHPGNLLVAATDPKTPKFIAVDFGIMGSLDSADQRYIAENFLAFFNRNYRRVAELHRESGWIPSTVRIDEFEASIRAVCEPIFERPLKDISFGTLMLRLFQTASRFHVVIQPQLILLQKTLLNVEGLARQLYPDLDLWKTAKPFLENWMKQQMGVESLIKKIKNNAPYWLEKLPELPNLYYQAMKNLSHLNDNFEKYAHLGHLQKEKVLSLQAKSSQKDFWFGILIGIALSLGLAFVLFLVEGHF